MADQRITELTELTVGPASGDWVPIVDIDAPGGAQTKKVSFSNFIAGGDLLPTADITNNIGSETLRWKDVFAQRIVAVGGDLAGNLIVTNAPAAGLSTSVMGFIDQQAGDAVIQIDGANGPPLSVAGYVINRDADGTAIMNASGQGSTTFGTVNNFGSGDALIENSGNATNIGGFITGVSYAISGGNSSMINRGPGLMMSGYIGGYMGNTALMETGPYTWGSFVSGAMFAYGGDCTMRSSGSGQFVSGYLWAIGYGTGGDLTMEAAANCKGVFVQGGLTSYNAASTGFLGISTTGVLGSFTQGFVRSYGGTAEAALRTSASGAFAQGYAVNGYTAFPGIIEATGRGAFAQGYAYNGVLTSTGKGSFVQGHANSGHSIGAEADGAFAVGNALTADIVATAVNAQQFGQGINALPDSLQVGTAGLRFKGTANAPGTPQDGDFWIDGAFITARSNGIDVPISDPGLSEVVSIDAIRTFSLADKGRTIVLTGSTPRTWTIDSNANLALPIGTLIAGESLSSAVLTVEITDDTLRSSADNTTGSRSIAAGGAFVIDKVATTEWKIAGNQMT